jgi:hypothetical protein
MISLVAAQLHCNRPARYALSLGRLNAGTNSRASAFTVQSMSGFACRAVAVYSELVHMSSAFALRGCRESIRNYRCQPGVVR